MKTETVNITGVADSSVVNHKAGYTLEMHDRPLSSMVLTGSGGGKIIYEYDGGSVVSDSRSVLFLPCGATYSLRCISGGEWYMINFSGSPEKKPPFCIDVGDSSQLYEIFFGIMNTDSQYKKMSLIYDLLDKMYRENSDLKIPALIKPQTEYLKKHFGDSEISNASLAKMTNISEVYFRRLFVKAFGMPPMTYLRKKRVENAGRLLRERSHSVEETAILCGYANLYYFSAAFKKETGYSPTEYSKLHGLL